MGFASLYPSYEIHRAVIAKKENLRSLSLPRKQR